MMRIFYYAQMLVKINIVILLLPVSFAISMDNIFPLSKDDMYGQVSFSEDFLLPQETGCATFEDFNNVEEPVIDYNQEAIDLGPSLHYCHEQDCSFSYTKLSNFQSHLKSKHGVENPYKCAECGKAFAYLSILKKHERTHTSERPFVCSWCGRGFKQSSHLKRHKRMHTGERPYKCSFKGCSQAFACTSNLKEHIRIHTVERPYKCSFPECSQAFARLPHLKEHIRIHTGERPYKCNFEKCGQEFASASNLTKHKKTHIEKDSSLSVLHKRKAEEVFIEPLEKFNIQTLYTPLEPLEIAAESSLDLEGLN